MKVCTKCNVEKDYSFYYLNKSSKNGYASICKNCRNIQIKEYVLKNKDKKDKYSKEYKEKNKELIKEKNKIYYLNNKHKIQEYAKENKEKIIQYKKLWDKKNKEKTKEYCSKYRKEYYNKNKEKIKEYHRTYRKENQKKIAEYRRIYEKNKNINDPVFKFSKAIRHNITDSFKRTNNKYKKNLRTETILGCTIEEFRIYIQNKFTEGMYLENHGEWHLDHIIPLSSATNEEEIIKLCHYTNYQPLWAKDNLSKGSKTISKIKDTHNLIDRK